MKKLLIASAMIVAISTSAFAQDESGAAYSKGQNTVSIGYGFISPWKTLFKLSSAFSGANVKFSQMGPIGLTYENGVAEHISVGIQVAYSMLKNVTTDVNGNSAGGDLITTEKLTQISAILRGNYHFGHSAKFDPYIGLGLGYGNFKYKVEDNDPNYNSENYFAIAVPGAFGFTGQLGAKYYFSSNIGLYAELGYLAGSYAQVGIAFKF